MSFWHLLQFSLTRSDIHVSKVSSLWCASCHLHHLFGYSPDITMNTHKHLRVQLWDVMNLVASSAQSESQGGSRSPVARCTMRCEAWAWSPGGPPQRICFALLPQVSETSLQILSGHSCILLCWGKSSYWSSALLFPACPVLMLIFISHKIMKTSLRNKQANKQKQRKKPPTNSFK